MRYLSVCSGIEAASVAAPEGWHAEAFAEIEPFPCAVLAHHYPDVPNHGDMTALPSRILAGEVEAPDILCGGTPCQAFSVAGQRQSLADARGNLTLTFVEIADAIDAVRRAAGHKPSIVVWENVPGVLNTADNAFGCFLAGVAGESVPLEPPGGRWTDAGAVYGPARAVAWRVLDAQYFGVAQRRRRVFVVASARDDFDCAAVLFEWGGVRRDTAPSREAGQGAAAAVGRCFASGRESDVAATLETTAHDYSRADGFTVCFHPVGSDPIHSSDGTTHAMTCGSAGGSASVAVAFEENFHAVREVDVAPAMTTEGYRVSQNAGGLGLRTAMQVRRLTPRECERLQGFPDNYTAIPWRKKTAADGPRYKAIGNSMAVPVMRWIFNRLDIVDKATAKPKANAAG